MTTSSSVSVHKFGGTSVGSIAAFEQVISLIENASCSSNNIAVVVSAIGGSPKVTDLLLKSLSAAESGDQVTALSTLDTIFQKHTDVLSHFNVSRINLTDSFNHLKEMIGAISILKSSVTNRVRDYIVGHGELWSAQILTSVLNIRASSQEKFEFVDARNAIMLHDDKSVAWESCVLPKSKNLVITGFIASFKQDLVPTTLERDGSDYTASIVARILSASEIVIWTDVNGVLSADPRIVREAQPLTHISYQEAMELAYFGAKVLHPKTMAPAVSKSIPIVIRNTFEPSHVGTTISSVTNANHIVSGFSTVSSLALFNIEGSGLISTLGFASRLFSTLERLKINVTLIAQASSEHSICFAVPSGESAERTQKALSDTFYREINQLKTIDEIHYEAPVTVIAAVGDNMGRTPGVCANFFNAIKNVGVNILAISQGSSERNISAVIKSTDTNTALRAAHSAFFAPKVKSIVIIKSSDDNTELYDALVKDIAAANQKYEVNVTLDVSNNTLVKDRKVYTFDNVNLALEKMMEGLSKNDVVVDLTTFNVAIASSALYKLGLQIFSCNLAASSSLNVNFEACIAPGLPISHTLQRHHTESVSAIFARTTLSLVFEKMKSDPSLSFSQSLQQLIKGDDDVHENPESLLKDLIGYTSALKLSALVISPCGDNIKVTNHFLPNSLLEKSYKDTDQLLSELSEFNASAQKFMTTPSLKVTLDKNSLSVSLSDDTTVNSNEITCGFNGHSVTLSGPPALPDIVSKEILFTILSS